MLYMARVALTGVHLLREGEVLADLPVLLERYPVPGVDRLLEIKEQAEHATLEDDAPYQDLFATLEALLTSALAATTLPEEPPAADALNAWLIQVRTA